jgi:hypothetical protein
VSPRQAEIDARIVREIITERESENLKRSAQGLGPRPTYTTEEIEAQLKKQLADGAGKASRTRKSMEQDSDYEQQESDVDEELQTNKKRKLDNERQSPPKSTGSGSKHTKKKSSTKNKPLVNLHDKPTKVTQDKKGNQQKSTMPFKVPRKPSRLSKESTETNKDTTPRDNTTPKKDAPPKIPTTVVLDDDDEEIAIEEITDNTDQPEETEVTLPGLKTTYTVLPDTTQIVPTAKGVPGRYITTSTENVARAPMHSNIRDQACT